MTSPRPAPSSASSRALQSFRGDLRTETPLHPLERALLVVAGLHLCFLPWALGTMHGWSQQISAGLAVVAFGLALIPRSYRGDLAPGGAYRLLMLPRLLRFPLFWLGLLFLGYVLVQALNPAWTYHVNDNRTWTLRPLDHTAWLPTSIEAPFERMNAWRMLLIYGATWLLACALWVGLTRRGSVHALLATLAINGALLGLVAIVQRLTGAREVLWFVERVPSYFVGTILYKNHAGAYWNLVLAVCTALVVYHFARSARRMTRSSASPLFLFCGLIAAATVFITYSRAATLLLLAFALLGGIGFTVWVLRWGRDGRSPAVMITFAVLFVGFAAASAYFLKIDRAFDRLDALFDERTNNQSVGHRQLAFQATWDMADAKLTTGWGAGGFRHMFPAYQRAYPEIWSTGGKRPRVYFWEYAHNDYLQGLAEVGLIGAGLVAAMLLTLIVMAARRGAFRRPRTLLLLVGLALTLAHATVDFQFYNPAILATWCALGVLAVRWTEGASGRGESVARAERVQ